MVARGDNGNGLDVLPRKLGGECPPRPPWIENIILRMWNEMWTAKFSTRSGGSDIGWVENPVFVL